MKILLLGDETRVLDEGAKNVATNLARVLGRSETLLVIHQREALRPAGLVKAVRFAPDVILTVHGPSARTVLLLAVLRRVCRGAITVVIGAQPHENPWMLRLLRVHRPALALAQSEKWREQFRGAGLRVAMLPNGVDTQKFSPKHDPETVRALRRQLGIPDGAKVALHIGPVNRNRNHELLARLRRDTNWQVVVIGSTTAPYVPEIAEMLRRAGVILCNEYFPDISTIYMLADVYIFPVMDKTGSIEMPLTVLEAMACDRPVVTAPFRGLPTFLKETDTLRYFRNFDELCTALDSVVGKTGNRNTALSFSWETVTYQLRAHIAEVR